MFKGTIPWLLWLWVNMKSFEKPRGDFAVFGNVDELDTPLNWMVKLVAIHASNIEKHPT